MWCSPPGDGVLSVHGHRADVPVREVAGRGRDRRADRAGTLRNGFPQTAETEK